MRYAAPIADFKTTVNKLNAINSDIITALESSFPAAVQQTKTFAKNFLAGTDQETANKVWTFLKSNINYRRDSEGRQQVRLPARLIADGFGDCKSYSLLAASVLANLGFKVGFRYTSYGNSSTPTHVYCIARKGGRSYIIDGVWEYFNTEKKYSFKKDNWMQVETLSGFDKKQKVVFNNPNDPKQLQLYYQALPNKKTLLARLVLKRLNPSGKTLNYTADQLAVYRKTLMKSLQLHPRTGSMANQIILDELTRVNSGTVTGAIFGYPSEIAGIAGKKKKVKKFFKKIGKKAGQIIKKGSLAGPRNAFLLLVKLNLFGLAKRLLRARNTDRAKYEKFWKNLGGRVSALDTAVTVGKKKVAPKYKKGLSGLNDYQVNISGLGDPVTLSLGAAVALATPILILVAKLFKKQPGDENITTDDLNSVASTLEAAGVPKDIIDTVKEVAGQAINSGGDIGPQPEDPEKDDPGTGSDLILPLALGAGLLLLAS